MENFKMYLEQLIPEKDSLKLVRTIAVKWLDIFNRLSPLSKISPHFKVARFKKIAHIDWLQLVIENTILIMRHGARK